MASLDVFAAMALVVLGVCFVVGRVTSSVTYPWLMALVSFTSAIAVLLTVHPGAVWTRRLLGSNAMAAIGRRSYGIYLWHWPVFVVVGATAGSWPRFVAGSVIALTLSEICFRFVEMPIRRGALGALWARRRSVAVLTGGLAASSVAVVVLNTLLRHAAARDPEHVTFVEGPDEWCGDESIATDVDYRWDGIHVYQRGANLVFETIAPALLAIPIHRS